jgi:hypothetical protein
MLDTCVATSLSSSVEITHRVMMIILEEVITKDGPFIKVEDLLRKYENRCIEKGFGPNDEYDMQSLLDMLSILVTDGVTDQVCFLSLINYRQLQIEFYKD